MQVKKFYRKKEVLAMIPFSESTMFRLIQANAFPAPYSLSPRAVGWEHSELMEWLSSRTKTVNNS